ncbi:putative bacteriocin processing peptidase C39 [Helicobacter cinaedi]|uniref:Putative bacteriocin processing peptidase C39 n=1 Tax=Helicobacter cinaedi TaxID=213 RepID=A0A377JVA0_9HELI|nr:C39 family peptidase [Helicobacter cinaedi]STP11858.1 putative bacteriocin processing peptidase C39 [Helicobacter cinaedi]
MYYFRILLFLWLFASGAKAHSLYNEPFYITKPLRSWIELRDENLTRQKYDYSCGAASLSSVMSYFYGVKVSEREILDFLLSHKGISTDKKREIEVDNELREKAHLSFSDLALFAQSKGFRTQGLALDFETLTKLQIPVIIYVNVRDMEHFSVYKGADSHYVYLADPSLGNIKVSKGKFLEMFYQRDDLTYPGKILAILSDTHKGNDTFFTHKTNTMIYKAIQDKALD